MKFSGLLRPNPYRRKAFLSRPSGGQLQTGLVAAAGLGEESSLGMGQELLETLGMSVFHATVEMKSGFRQVILAENTDAAGNCRTHLRQMKRGYVLHGPPPQHHLDRTLETRSVVAIGRRNDSGNSSQDSFNQPLLILPLLKDRAGDSWSPDSLSITDQQIALQVGISQQSHGCISSTEQVQLDHNRPSDDLTGISHSQIDRVAGPIPKQRMLTIVNHRMEIDIVGDQPFEQLGQVTRKHHIEISRNSIDISLPLLVVVVEQFVSKKAAKNQPTCTNDPFGHSADEIILDLLKIDLNVRHTFLGAVDLLSIIHPIGWMMFFRG